jgi:hypothetical protein
LGGACQIALIEPQVFQPVLDHRREIHRTPPSLTSFRLSDATVSIKMISDFP